MKKKPLRLINFLPTGSSLKPNYNAYKLLFFSLFLCLSVDSYRLQPNTRRDLEFTKINTLRLFLDQEKKNLENLKTSNNANRNEIAQAETNILRLQEQLRQMHGEVSDRFECFFLFFLLVMLYFVIIVSFWWSRANNSKLVPLNISVWFNLLTSLTF